MANRFPLVFDAGTAKSIQELPTGDNLNLSGSSIINAVSITATGTITVPTLNSIRMYMKKYLMETNLLTPVKLLI